MLKKTKIIRLLKKRKYGQSKSQIKYTLAKND